MAINGEGTYQDFNYTGGMQTLVIPSNGLYKLEVWGAQGGAGHVTPNDEWSGSKYVQYGTVAKGGYSNGYKYFEKGQTVYVCVGGAGGYGKNLGGYNGGGNGWSYDSYDEDDDYRGPAWNGHGGGATHMALVTGTLSAIGKANFGAYGLLVAGGSGGGGVSHAYSTFSSGSGGGLNGANTSGDFPTIYGGTQTSGGSYGGSFGKGGSSGAWGGAGGGGGYYGGGAGGNYNGGEPGGGGSGWIGGVPTITFKGVTYSPSTTNGQRSGHGMARITFVKKGDEPIKKGSTDIINTKLGLLDIYFIKKGSTTIWDNSKAMLVHVLNQDIDLRNLSVVPPSNTSFDKATKRTWTRNSIVVGVASDGYYSPGAVSSYSRGSNSLTVLGNSGYGVGWVLPSSIVAGKTYKINYAKSANYTASPTIMFYNSSGERLSYTVPNTEGVFTMPSNAAYAILVIQQHNINVTMTITRITEIS